MGAPRETGRRRWAHVVTAALGLALAAAPSAVQAALTTASIADLDLPPVTPAHVDQTSAGTMVLTVTDSGLSLGWNVTVQASGFAYSGPYGGTTIPAANFSITEALSPVRVVGQAIDPVGGPSVAPGATGSLDVARKTVRAQFGYGTGTYRQNLDVSLVVPANSRAGTYTAGLTVTASAGP